MIEHNGKKGRWLTNKKTGKPFFMSFEEEFTNNMLHGYYKDNKLNEQDSFSVWNKLKQAQREQNDKTHLYTEYREVLDYVMREGRGLNSTGKLTSTQQKVADLANKLSMTVNQDVTLFRTDSTEWLSNASNGDVIPITGIMQATTYSDLVISENKGKVAQKIIINVPKGTKLFCENNPGEQQVDVVNGQSFRIDGRYFDESDVPIYVITIVKG